MKNCRDVGIFGVDCCVTVNSRILIVIYFNFARGRNSVSVTIAIWKKLSTVATTEQFQFSNRKSEVQLERQLVRLWPVKRINKWLLPGLQLKSRRLPRTRIRCFLFTCTICLLSNNLVLYAWIWSINYSLLPAVKSLCTGKHAPVQVTSTQIYAPAHAWCNFSRHDILEKKIMSLIKDLSAAHRWTLFIVQYVTFTLSSAFFVADAHIRMTSWKNLFCFVFCCFFLYTASTEYWVDDDSTSINAV